MARVYRNRSLRNAQDKPAWCIDYVGLDGRRIRERTEACTKEDAERILRDKLTEVDKAQVFKLATVDQLQPKTFIKFVEEDFLPQVQAQKARPATYLRYQTSYHQVKRDFGTLEMRAINASHIASYRAKRLKEPNGKLSHVEGCPEVGCCCLTISPATINRDIAFINNVLNRAVPAFLDRNPLAGIKRLKLRESNQRTRTMTGEEESDILAETLKPEWLWLRPIFQIARLTGMRMGEILRLKWDDIEGGFIRISSESKSHRERMVRISPELKAIIDAIPTTMVQKDGRTVPSPFLFTNYDTAEAYTVDGVSGAFRRLAKAIGAEDLWFHDIRRTVVSDLCRKGFPDRVIMKLVGHTTAGMVSRYAHLRDSDLEDAARALGEVAVVAPVVQIQATVGKSVANHRMGRKGKKQALATA